jgi:hypothetical protein
MTNLEKCERILQELERAGFEREALPGPGDLADAIRDAGYVLLKGDEDDESDGA